MNITNPNDVAVRLKRLLVTLAQSASRDRQSVSMTTEIIHYRRSFGDDEMSYYWSPHSSKLVAFTATGELANLELEALKLGKGYLLVKVDGRSQTGSHVGSGFNLKEVTLEITGKDEYVFNTAFVNNYRFGFTNENPYITYGW